MKEKKLKQFLRKKEYLPKFKKIIPYDYKKMLETIAKMEQKGLNPEQAQIEAFYAATR